MRSGRRIILCVRTVILRIRFPGEGRVLWLSRGTGLIWSGFRPSDDSCVYGYLIPSNMFAVVVLGYLAEIANQVLGDEALAAEAEAFGWK